MSCTEKTVSSDCPECHKSIRLYVKPGFLDEVEKWPAGVFEPVPGDYKVYSYGVGGMRNPCPICGADMSHKRKNAQACSPKCRAEKSRRNAMTKYLEKHRHILRKIDMVIHELKVAKRLIEIEDE